MTNQKLALRLIRKCEILCLNEQQALELINNILSDKISRSTYYKYKKKLYQDENINH